MKLRFITKIIIGIVLTEALIFALIIWNGVRLTNEGYSDILHRSMKEETALLASALSPGLAADDRALVLDTLSLLKESEDLAYAIVYNRQGEIYASIGNTENVRYSYVQDFGAVDLANRPEDYVYNLRQEIIVAGQKLGLVNAGYTLKPAKRSIDSTRAQNLVLAILGLVITIAITVLGGYYILQRLAALEEGATRLGNGDLDYRIPVVYEDEISRVASTFNTMANNLNVTRAALQAEHESLVFEKSRLNTLLDGIDAVVYEGSTDEFTFRFVSQEAQNLLGYPIKEWLIPGFLWSHVHPEDVQDVQHKLKKKAGPGQSLFIDFRMLHINDYYIWVRNIVSFEIDVNNDLIARGLIIDINEQKQSEEQILYLVQHDVLTGLYNRRRFQEDLQKTILYSNRNKLEFGLLFIDLDQFKFINDTLGHHIGDKHLVSVALKLKETLRETDIIGRIGGDEFAVIVNNGDVTNLKTIARKILEALGRNYTSDDSDIIQNQISASIGIALYPAHGTESEELLAKADAAMYTAKAGGKNTYHIFDDSDNQLLQMQEKLHWENKIRYALSSNGFRLHYQPIYNLESGMLSHHEALLRMTDGDSGNLITPASFMEIAERFGLIYDIDLWVLETAIQTLASDYFRQKHGVLSVNISGRSLEKINMVNKISDWLEKYNVSPDRLVIELTETSAVENIIQANNLIGTLHKMGCRIALDDFGAGFSSLRYLRHLAIDSIKIDGSFIRGIASDPSNQMLVKAICDIAKGLEVNTVAEYVDNESTISILKELGVDYGQGYFLGKPQADPVETLETII